MRANLRGTLAVAGDSGLAAAGLLALATAGAGAGGIYGSFASLFASVPSDEVERAQAALDKVMSDLSSCSTRPLGLGKE